MWQIFLKEIGSFFNSLAAYIALVIFLLLVGLFVWVFPQSNVLDGGYAELDALFVIAPYIFMFLIPAITMRSFAEERSTGTIEWLFTKPVSSISIILGKLLACITLAIFALLPTLTYYFSIYELGMPAGNVDTAAVIGSYIGLLLLAATFNAIGIFASSLTNNQIVAFMLSVFLCFMLYDGFTSLAAIDVWSEKAYVVSMLGIDYHYQSISKGLIDSRNVLYFLSLITIMVACTRLVIDSRKW